MTEQDCIFSKIVKGEIPAQRVYEDEEVLAFLDINPISDGHTLVIPKQKHKTIDECPPEVLAQLALRLGKIAKAVKDAMNCDGYNVLCFFRYSHFGPYKDSGISGKQLQDKGLGGDSPRHNLHGDIHEILPATGGGCKVCREEPFRASGTRLQENPVGRGNKEIRNDA